MLQCCNKIFVRGSLEVTLFSQNLIDIDRLSYFTMEGISAGLQLKTHNMLLFKVSLQYRIMTQVHLLPTTVTTGNCLLRRSDSNQFHSCVDFFKTFLWGP